ncbi:MAG: hypothetical protein ACR2PM_01620 [Hyphomicrobiales bacterium]
MKLHFPLLIIVLLAYNIVVFFTGISLNGEIFSLTMVSGVLWTFQVSDLLILIALVLLFFEVLKATRTGAGAIIDHLLSTVVFIVALIEFILVGKAATSTFFLLVVITLVDVIAGYSVSITSARRDLSIGHPDSYV